MYCTSAANIAPLRGFVALFRVNTRAARPCGRRGWRHAPRALMVHRAARPAVAVWVWLAVPPLRCGWCPVNAGGRVAAVGACRVCSVFQSTSAAAVAACGVRVRDRTAAHTGFPCRGQSQPRGAGVVSYLLAFLLALRASALTSDNFKKSRTPPLALTAARSLAACLALIG